MTTNQVQTETLYELALAISPADTVEETATRALTAYLDSLDCESGAVFEWIEHADGTVSYHPVVALPEDRSDALHGAIEHLPADEPDAQFRESLPVVGTVRETEYVLMDLPAFGVVILTGGRLDADLRAALAPLNEKLADACRRNRIEAELREERNRFETVFEAIKEPVVNVVFEDGDPIVRRVNPAFERTFGHAEEEALGKNLDALIAPEDPGDDSQQGHYTSGGATPELRRRTADGEGHFLIRSATVVSSVDSLEQFELYIDITDEKIHQRRLERLYDEAMSILSATDRDHVADQAVETVAEIVEGSLAEILLYDRTLEGLVPVATTAEASEVVEAFTDHDTVVWESYRDGEAVVVDDVEGTVLAVEFSP